MEQLEKLRTTLRIEYGSFEEEKVEQEMSILFINENDIVLELGGNIGRNSLIIGSILKDSRNLVVVESNASIAPMLEMNRNLNEMHFKIIPKALSRRQLIQSDWNTVPIEENEEVPEGWHRVETIDMETLKRETDLIFNVLVCDCEGALYYILCDEPSFLDQFEKVLMENDFWNEEHEKYVEDRLIELGFEVVFSRDLDYFRPRPDFWKVWVRK